MKYFLDTSAILSDLPKDIQLSECVICSESIKELENIKISRYKDNDIKHRARQAVLNIINHKPTVVAYEDSLPEGDNISTDKKILLTANSYDIRTEKITLLTKDYLMYLLADSYFIKAELIDDKQQEVYRGYKYFSIDDDALGYFYEHPEENTFECVINEYVILQTTNGEELPFKWDGEKYCSVAYKSLKSKMFNNIKPKDIYQQCAIDSLISNDITVLLGKAGSGKSILALAYAMNMLDSHKYSKIDVIHHFEPLKHSRTLGFTKGDDLTKKITSGIGNILATKFGDITEVERMYHANILNITPTSNIRGMEVDQIVFVDEAQNIDAYTLKTIIQRCKEGSKLIFCADLLEQSDLERESGLWKMIDIFKGDKSFSTIKLKSNYRNNIGNLADLL